MALDFETANPKRASVCSVGLVRVDDGVITGQRQYLMRPPPCASEFHQRNIAVHGITQARVSGEPTFADRYPLMMKRIVGRTLVAHNVACDRSVMAAACRAVDLPVPENDWLCTYRLSESMLHLPTNRLPVVAEHLGIGSFHHHDALADALACAEIMIELARRCPQLLGQLRTAV